MEEASGLGQKVQYTCRGKTKVDEGKRYGEEVSRLGQKVREERREWWGRRYTGLGGKKEADKGKR